MGANGLISGSEMGECGGMSRRMECMGHSCFEKLLRVLRRLAWHPAEKISMAPCGAR